MKACRADFRMGLGVAALGAALLSAGPVLAQSTPPELRDLVGARGSSGENALQQRGYVNAGGAVGDDRSWTYWWNGRQNACISVATRNGRYDSIVSTPAADCGRDGSGGGGNGGYRPPEFGYGDSYDRSGYREHLALICYGSGRHSEARPDTGYQWDADKNRYVPRSGYTWSEQDYNTSVTIEIDGNQGRIRPASNMVPPLHSGAQDGWYDLNNLSVSRDFVRAEFRFSGLNKPKLTIDRRAGHIQIEGLTPFDGECHAMDSDRRF